MESREKELKNVQTFIQKIDTEVTMILQQFQWDRTYLLEKPSMVTCKYNSNHRIPTEKRDIHETECYFRTNGYTKDDVLLPDPVNSNAGILIKLDKNHIKSVIDYAAKADPTFKRGSDNAEPMSLERLQVAYTADERRVIHDAVVNAAPTCHDLADLALLCENEDEQKNAKQKSRLEILAELRDMKRRRTKYRVAAKTRNYSDLLRDVIKTQMEVYSATKEEQTKQKQQEQDNDDKRRYMNKKFQTDAEESNNKHNKEKYQGRIKDNVNHSHYRHDSDKTRRDTLDNRRNVNSSMTEDEDNKKRKRKRSQDRSHNASKNERNCDSEYHQEKERYKKNRSESQRRLDEDCRSDKNTTYHYEKAHSSRSNYNRDIKDKIVQTKYKSKDDSHSTNNTFKYEDADQIYVKREPDTNSDNSQKNSYDYFKYKGKSKFRREKSHFRNKPDKHNRDYYTRRKTPKREDSPRYRRYYD